MLKEIKHEIYIQQMRGRWREEISFILYSTRIPSYCDSGGVKADM